MVETRDEILRRIEQVALKLADAKARLPKHTPRPSMLIEIEELEEELARLRTLLDPS
ncbi:MAG: histidine kinase [Chloroflexi bacterium]|nr:histidine kinase [Chloroflexota bacterium]